ncbi:hypothetical protein SteCoe_15217 [Stentor coeruleus]|uniref:Uncharacterized protein n=1 Tax=Stentor coeruleus TaxID=5963 RepID=A0A1R2C483_9CILI|nr:hypothetical protein SteCoe_15217 [Stentor coeruleus]
MVLRQSMEGPIFNSNYTRLIKLCLSTWGHNIANSLGALILEFRDNIGETENFKVTFYLDETKYLVLLVKGGLGRIARTKYRVNESSISRYDWRSNFWHKLMRIVNFATKIAFFVSKYVPGAQLALPYIGAARIGGRVISKMITYDRPTRIRGRSYY